MKKPNLKSQTSAAVILAVLLCLAAAPQAIVRETGLESIRIAELQEKVNYLASKEMKGRGNGSPELRVAAEYIARVFQRNGIKPAGDANTYFQSFEMFSSRLGPSNELRVENRVFRLGSDYVPHYLSPKGEARAPSVFVGYGLKAPHLKFDELAGVNLKGKIAVALDQNPRSEDAESPFNRFHISDFASISTKARDVRNAGAVGLIIIQGPGSYGSVEELASTFDADYSRRFVPMGDVSDPENPPIPVMMVSWDVGRSLVNGLSGVRQRIEDTLQPQKVESENRITLRVDVERVTFPTQNVLGLIEGSDSQLRREVLVLGAHYDHDGESSGQIWPGADDNASGTAAILELAEAFGNGRPTPRRSILLAAFAGEEKGEIGSQHYVTHPVIPNDRVIGMIQLDMIGRNEEHGPDRRLGLQRETSAENANSVNIIGSTYTPDLGRQFEEANKSVGLLLKFRYDATPENLLRRSDQWPFLKMGIPALFIHTGEHPDYHRPTDTADKINYQKLEKIVRLVFLVAERAAGSSPRPRFVQP